MNLQPTLYVLSLILAGGISAVLAVFAWRRRPAMGATPFAVLMLAVAEWALTYALELASSDLPGKVLWDRLEFVGIVAVPAAWLVLALQYGGRGRWLTPRRLALLGVEPLVVLALVWTNASHGLIWKETWLETSIGFPMLGQTPHIGFWIHTAYSYALLLLGTLLFGQAFVRPPRLYSRQAGVLLIGALVPWVGNVLALVGLSPLHELDLTPFAFTLTGIAAGWGLFGFQFLDIVPVARDAIIESMSDGVMVLDPKNRIVDVNPAAQHLIGRTASDIIGQPATQALARWTDLIERCRDVIQAHAEIVLGEGEAQRDYDLHVSPLQDRRGRLTGRLVILRDITERKQVEEELRKAKEAAEAANIAKTDFVSLVSHELRIPMTSIKGYADLLAIGAAGSVNPAQAGFLDTIRSNVDRMTKLVGDLTDITRIESGRLRLELSAVNVAEVVEEVVQSTRRQIEEKAHTLTLQIAGDLPPVRADRSRLSQILTNLISNAYKYTPPGGRITLCAEQFLESHQVVHVVVQDNGIGLSLEDQEKIFSKFFRSEDQLVREAPGTGLGLNITKNLVELQGGRIWFDSALHKGTAFHFIMPVADDVTPPRAIASMESPNPKVRR